MAVEVFWYKISVIEQLLMASYSVDQCRFVDYKSAYVQAVKVARRNS
jgi:hypothetical protein